MADFMRLTQEQKFTLVKMHEKFKDSELNNRIESAAEQFEELPHSGEYILISKPEVTDEVWGALVKAGIGQERQFENSDSNPDYKKALEVERNLFEAILQLLEIFIREIIKVLTGKGPGVAEGRTPNKIKKHQYDVEDTYLS